MNTTSFTFFLNFHEQKQAEMQRFIRRQTMILLDNPIGLCNADIMGSRDKNCSKQKNAELFKNIGSTRKRIDPYKVRSKYNFNNKNEKNHKWSSRFAGYTHPSGQDEDVFEESKMDQRITNAWSYAEFVQFDERFRKTHPAPPGAANDDYLVQKMDGSFEWQKYDESNSILAQAKTRQLNKDTSMSLAFKPQDTKRYIIYEKQIDDVFVGLIFSTKVIETNKSNVIFGDNTSPEPIMILDSNTSKIKLNTKKSIKYFSTRIVCLSKGSYYPVKYKEGNNKSHFLYYTKKNAKINNFELLPLVTIKKSKLESEQAQEAYEYILVEHPNAWYILKQLLFSLPRYMQEICVEQNIIICFDIRKPVSNVADKNVMLLSHAKNQLNDFDQPFKNVFIKMQSHSYQLVCNYQNIMQPLSWNQQQFVCEGIELPGFTEHVRQNPLI